jgi:hypothetical protein
MQNSTFLQLSILVSLETLDVSQHLEDPTLRPDFRLSSRGGYLEKLNTLSKLQSIKFYDSSSGLGEEEKEWARSRWGNQFSFIIV